jgi:hypothetical protein
MENKSVQNALQQMAVYACNETKPDIAVHASRSTCVSFFYDNHHCALMKRFNAVLLLLFSPISAALGWGFFAHKQINRHAVFTLPPAMFSFYKKHMHFITEHAINPDKRCYAVEGEAPRHYIDLEYYGDSVWKREDPWYWGQAVEVHTKDEAFRQKDVHHILRLSADIGHYIADANVPLHTSENYNGQFTGQEGIHALWETRLPELFLDGYDFFVGTAEYVSNPQKSVWEAIKTAHEAVSSVLNLEKKLSENFPASKKYSFEQRGSTLQKVYSKAYAQAYHEILEGQVERQMRASVKMVGDFWLTCWVDAGQPELDALLQLPFSEDQLQEDFSKHKKLKVRACGE